MKRDLGTLTGREFDVLVIGGGIHGAAAAWDATQRGLATALVEADDFGSGTSWNSLKTIHGGLRYLQTLDFRRMRESIRERRALLRIAPRLVRPVPFVVPTYGHGWKGREAFGLAMRLNDLASADRNEGLALEHQIPSGRLLSGGEMLALFPAIRQEALTGGALWTDAQAVSSERLTLAFVHAAAEAGAVVANHVEAVSLPDDHGRIVGARVLDRIGGGETDIRAGMVLNAAGPGMDRLLAIAGIRRKPVPLLRAINLMLRRPVVTTHALGASSAGRFLFLVPWGGRSIVGTAYGPPDETVAAAGRRFLDEVRTAYPWADLVPDDVALVHRGLVPGIGGVAGLATRHLLLDHTTTDGVAGLVSVQGVKYTTARAVAEEAVDLVLRRLGRTASPCRTATVPLRRAFCLEGSLADQARVAAREEMALTLADAVLRRLDLGTAGPPAAAEIETVADVLAAEHGWSAVRLEAERQALSATYVNLHGESG